MDAKEKWYLPTDDGDGGEGFPECRKSTIGAAIVSEHRARPLDPIHQPDQALHRRHRANPNPRSQEPQSEEDKALEK